MSGFSLTPQARSLRLVPDLDNLPALAIERESLWASLEKTSFLTSDEKRALAGFSPAPADQKFNPGQLRIPAGSPDGGQWADDGGGGDDGDGNLVHPAQIRRPRAGSSSRAREQYLADLTNQARQAVDRLREIDPTWREPQSASTRGDVEGNIRHQQLVRDAAQARLAEITRDAVPGANPSWGVNRLTKELHDRGFILKREARGDGLIYQNPSTGAEIRVMERQPGQARAQEPPQKYYFGFYYRYRSGGDQGWGSPIPIPDK